MGCFQRNTTKTTKKLQNRAARIILDMSKELDRSIALCALDWESHKIERQAKIMHRILREVGPH